MTDENFQNLALNESFERVAKVAKERDAFNEQMPKPDPLVDVLKDFGGFMPDADDFRAALDARGLEIREKAND